MLIDKLYTIEFKDDTKAIVKLSNKNHPIFKAHFPDHPILPGFVHFEVIADAFNLHISTIKKAKFLKTALPEQTLIYTKDNNKFSVVSENEEIASFSI
ncbi:MAG: hypothetical protein P794_09255 [Epsilonproteobacteria bacterium (ex Lamellibrachia satsuma)]|nr:MAG: hypothetical protein P794_09255 [Epsilonproteobacteria bacterium (ex Lamellibrachia satsuma)]